MTVLDEPTTEWPLRGKELELRLESSYQSLRKIVRRTLGHFPTVRRWDETDDVLQVAYSKFHAEVLRKPPRSEAHFFALAAKIIRNKIIDLARKYNGPHGLQTNHQTNGHLAIESSSSCSQADQISLERWADFHQHVAALPEDIRSVVDQLWYNEQKPTAVAECLGVSLSTVQRRWSEAQRLLAKEACGICPE